MIVNNLYILGPVIRPIKTDSPSVVDPNTVLTFAITFELLKLIAWQRRQVAQVLGIVYLDQFTSSDSLNVARQFSRRKPAVDFPRFVEGFRPDHAQILSRDDNIAKRYYPASSFYVGELWGRTASEMTTARRSLAKITCLTDDRISRQSQRCRGRRFGRA